MQTDNHDFRKNVATDEKYTLLCLILGGRGMGWIKCTGGKIIKIS